MWTFFTSFLFHAKLFNCTVHGAIAAISIATHGCQVLLMLKPECFLCLHMFEIQVPFIWLQPEIPKQADQTCLFLLQRNLKKKTISAKI
jgi:hypothetical protein